MKMLKLFADEGSDSDVELKTNTGYASAYNLWRQKEELNKLKTKYGDTAILQDALLDDESSSSDDDDEISEELDKNFFKTLSCLKNKDPKIYDDKVVFFNRNISDDKNENEKTKKKKKQEPLYLKDYERKMILEKGAKFDDSDEETEEDMRSHSPTYVEEQNKLKESLKNALKDDEADDEENWGGLFQKRQKTKEEQEKEDDDYKQWLKGSNVQLENKEDEQELKPLKQYWNKPDLDSTETFLRDYLLNERYLEKDDENHIPTYEEIIHDSDEGLSEDEKAIDAQEEFEVKYNHRFEEPDQEFIKRYPRTMEHSVRKTDDRRKMKRVEIKERKEIEKKQKQDDLKQLKILKRKEIEEKIQKLKEITGNEEMAFHDNDLEDEFDPEAHDKRMQELFNDDYYAGPEGDDKPQFDDDELGSWRNETEPHCEDDDFNMDCDYDPNVVPKRKDKKGKKKRNKNEKEINENELPLEENDARYERYMDELYKLDYEDMIGDIPCRFKYREVIPNDFGLTMEEIILAKDKELNRWCSLKKAVQHRPEYIEKYEVLAYKKKSRNEDLKRKILPSIYDNVEENDEISKNVNTIKKIESDEDGEINKDSDNNQLKEKKKRKHKGTDRENSVGQNINENLEENDEISKNDNKIKKTERAEDYNIHINSDKKQLKEKKNRKRKESERDNSIEQNINEATDTDVNRKKVKFEENNLNNDINNTEHDNLIKNSSKKGKKRKRSVSETNEQNISSENARKKKISRRQRKNLKLKLTKPENNKEKTNTTNNVSKAKQKKNKKNFLDKTIAISDARLTAYGINPKKYKNKLKYKNKSDTNKVNKK